MTRFFNVGFLVTVIFVVVFTLVFHFFTEAKVTVFDYVWALFTGMVIPSTVKDIVNG